MGLPALSSSIPFTPVPPISTTNVVLLSRLGITPLYPRRTEGGRHIHLVEKCEPARTTFLHALLQISEMYKTLAFARTNVPNHFLLSVYFLQFEETCTFL